MPWSKHQDPGDGSDNSMIVLRSGRQVGEFKKQFSRAEQRSVTPADKDRDTAESRDGSHSGDDSVNYVSFEEFLAQVKQERSSDVDCDGQLTATTEVKLKCSSSSLDYGSQVNFYSQYQLGVNAFVVGDIVPVSCLKSGESILPVPVDAEDHSGSRPLYDDEHGDTLEALDECGLNELNTTYEESYIVISAQESFFSVALDAENHTVLSPLDNDKHGDRFRLKALNEGSLNELNTISQPPDVTIVDGPDAKESRLSLLVGDEDPISSSDSESGKFEDAVEHLSELHTASEPSGVMTDAEEYQLPLLSVVGVENSSPLGHGENEDGVAKLVDDECSLNELHARLEPGNTKDYTEESPWLLPTDAEGHARPSSSDISRGPSDESEDELEPLVNKCSMDELHSSAVTEPSDMMEYAGAEDQLLVLLGISDQSGLTALDTLPYDDSESGLENQHGPMELEQQTNPDADADEQLKTANDNGGTVVPVPVDQVDQSAADADTAQIQVS